jgi:hypothetical protein
MIRHPKDFVAGLLFAGVGILAIIIASNYPLGTAARMGPGYFPRILGILLILLGGALALRALKLNGPPLPRWHWRPVVVSWQRRAVRIHPDQARTRHLHRHPDRAVERGDRANSVRWNPR